MSMNDRFNIIATLAVLSTVISLSLGFVPLPTDVSKVPALAYCSTASDVPDVESKAAFAMDISTRRVLLAEHEHAQLPLASLTKLMTVYAALDSLSLDEFVIISSDALSAEGDSGLYENERWVLQDLIDFTLISSSNDGARAIALSANAKITSRDTLGPFIARMNDSTSELGMGETYFLNETGLDVSTTTPGALGSAHDIAMLMSGIYRSSLDAFSGSVRPEMSFNIGTRTHDAENTNGVSHLIPQVLVSKTGYTDLAGGNLAVLYEPVPGHPVAAVILGSTRENRESDIIAMTDAAQRELRKQLICDSFSQ